MVNDWEEWAKKGGFQGRSYKEGEVKNLNLGTAFEGEFLIFITPRLAAGIGTGFSYAELTEDDTSLTMERHLEADIFVKPIKINAHFVNLSAHYFHPLTDRLRLYVRGGVGFIWAKYLEREGFKGGVSYFEQEATDSSQSFFSSLGFTYEANSFMDFSSEAEFRFLKLDGFQSDVKDGESGTLYFFEEYDTEMEFWRAKIAVENKKPSEGNFRSVEEAVVDLSRFSIKIGFIIKF